MIRQKISQAEIDLYFDMLAGLDWHPVFLVLVVVDDGDRAIERARATLLAMGRHRTRRRSSNSGLRNEVLQAPLLRSA